MDRFQKNIEVMKVSFFFFVALCLSRPYFLSLALEQMNTRLAGSRYGNALIPSSIPKCNQNAF